MKKKKLAFTRLVKPFAHSYGFTLAEVLITLTILGVVAAITVPSLQKMNYKRTQISRMAKGYVTLEQASTNIAKNTNCLGKDLKCTGLLDITDEDALNEKFFELAEFRINSKYSGKYKGIRSLYCGEHKDSTCTGYTHNPLKIYYTSPDSMGYYVSKINLFSKHGVYAPALRAIILTDSKKMKDKIDEYSTSAIMGRDAFLFTIYDNFQVEPVFVNASCSIYPASKIPDKEKSTKFCDPNIHNTQCYIDGSNCAARIIKEGWKMNY